MLRPKAHLVMIFLLVACSQSEEHSDFHQAAVARPPEFALLASDLSSLQYRGHIPYFGITGLAQDWDISAVHIKHCLPLLGRCAQSLCYNTQVSGQIWKRRHINTISAHLMR